jgi:hypothetical protein
MDEWFYVKNDLKAREDIKEVIMHPIWSRFGLRRLNVEIDEAAEACQKAFGTVCFFIGTRDLIQEHITRDGNRVGSTRIYSSRIHTRERKLNPYPYP